MSERTAHEFWMARTRRLKVLWVTDCVMDGARLRSSVVEHDWRRLRADGSRNEREN